jgi:hypothetical protein
VIKPVVDPTVCSIVPLTAIEEQATPKIGFVAAEKTEVHQELWLFRREADPAEGLRYALVCILSTHKMNTAFHFLNIKVFNSLCLVCLCPKSGVVEIPPTPVTRCALQMYTYYIY